MKNQIHRQIYRQIYRLIVTVGAATLALGFSAVANASSLRQGTSVGSEVTGALPGQVQWAFWQTIARGRLCFELAQSSASPAIMQSGFIPENLCNTASEGDNILRLVNPNGAANGNLAEAETQTVCAMIYVFDDDEEMGECCGCPLSSTRLATFSVIHNLTSNWGLAGGEEGGIYPFNAYGSMAVVAAAPNALGCLAGGGGEACNGGCDPTNSPGYSVTTTNNLLGSITHSQAVATNRIAMRKPAAAGGQTKFGSLTEVGLYDDAGGDPTNLTYLQTQCGALVGNGTGGGICNCPTE